MKISITKKIMGMVVLPILFICLVVGIISANIMRNNIVEDIDKTINSIYEINMMVENMNSEIKAMVDTISNLSAISEENSAATEETMAAIEELNATISQVYEKAQNVDKSADMLMNEVNVFKTV